MRTLGVAEKRGVGKTGPVEEEKTARAVALYDHIVTEFPKTLDDEGELTPASVKEIMDAVQAARRRVDQRRARAGADHAFCFVVEIAADKYWIHGEMCALEP